MCTDSLQFDWDLERQEIAVFVRNRDGGDAVAPATLCTLDEWLECIAVGDRRRLRAKLTSLSASSTRSFEFQFRLAMPDGRQQWMDVCGMAVRDEHARLRRVVGQQRKLVGPNDCTPSLLPSPYHDPLTGLPNRWLFERCLASAVECARLDDAHRFAILFVDLDGFKAINDRHGHLMGDRTLIAVAQRFGHCVRPEDMLARRDGDEFTILVKDMWQHDDAVAVAERILQQVRAPLSLDGTELVVTASVGIALARADLREPNDLLHSADEAMYQAKAHGGDRFMIAGRNSQAAD
jgi:diguanylate cyclase (GGDEF)-like protein